MIKKRNMAMAMMRVTVISKTTDMTFFTRECHSLNVTCGRHRMERITPNTRPVSCVN